MRSTAPRTGAPPARLEDLVPDSLAALPAKLLLGSTFAYSRITPDEHGRDYVLYVQLQDEPAPSEDSELTDRALNRPRPSKEKSG